jgi:hypothetical protein
MCNIYQKIEHMLQYLATDKKQIITCMLLHGETFDTSRFFCSFFTSVKNNHEGNGHYWQQKPNFGDVPIMGSISAIRSDFGSKPNFGESPNFGQIILASPNWPDRESNFGDSLILAMG